MLASKTTSSLNSDGPSTHGSSRYVKNISKLLNHSYKSPCRGIELKTHIILVIHFPPASLTY